MRCEGGHSLRVRYVFLLWCGNWTCCGVRSHWTAPLHCHTIMRLGYTCVCFPICGSVCCYYAQFTIPPQLTDGPIQPLSDSKHTVRSRWQPASGRAATGPRNVCVCVCACVCVWWGLIIQPKSPTQIIRGSDHMLQLLCRGLWQLSVTLLACKHSSGGHSY